MPSSITPAEPSRTSDQIDLWTVDLDQWAGVHGDRLDAVTLTDVDRAHASRLGQGLTARRLLARRSAARSILASALGTSPGSLTIERHCPRCGSTAHGRPRIAGDPLEFSVSSAQGVAVIAVAHTPVGIDVEVVGEATVVLERALTSDELRRLMALPAGGRAVGFLRLWTGKEAVLKAAGRDLGDDPASIDVAGLLVGDTVRFVDAGRTWFVRQLPCESFKGLAVLLGMADELGGPVVRHVLER